jgi:hypothetical protein
MSLLDELLAELRTELRNELPIVLHPGARIRGHRHTKRAIRDEDTSHESGGSGWHSSGAGYGTRIGLPFTVGFERRLSHPDWWGINELAARSILEVGDFCRSRHQSDLHRCPGRSTSLCERVVSAMAQFGQPVGQIAWREGLDEELVYALAVQGLRHAFAWRHRRLHQYMRSATDRERDQRVTCPLCDGRPIRMRRRAA